MSGANELMLKLACVGLILCVVFPVGQTVFPAATGMIGELPFSAIEAAVTAGLGLGLFQTLFG